MHTKTRSVSIVHCEDIKNKIYTIRGIQVMVDRDLAELYEVETRDLNKAVQRNIKRFPKDFMFELRPDEFKNLMFQNGTSRWGGTRKPAKVFTEIGVATLSGILHSDVAIQANIKIMRAFFEMRQWLVTHAHIFQRLDTTERNLLAYKLDTDKKFEKVFEALEHNDIKPQQGIFFNGQIFDAYAFVLKLIRKAKESLILIDNYIDETVLTTFDERNKGVEVVIVTKEKAEKLQLLLGKHNQQYAPIRITQSNIFHDRFLIIDEEDVYHIGASIKDLGKKCFAFSKMEAAFFVQKLLDTIKTTEGT